VRVLRRMSPVQCAHSDLHGVGIHYSSRQTGSDLLQLRARRWKWKRRINARRKGQHNSTKRRRRKKNMLIVNAATRIDDTPPRCSRPQMDIRLQRTHAHGGRKERHIAFTLVSHFVQEKRFRQNTKKNSNKSKKKKKMWVTHLFSSILFENGF